MKRRDKYPDTEYFHYYNANPKNKITSDCLLRAITGASERDYRDIARELFEFGLKTGYNPQDKNCYSKYLESKGWTRHKQPVKEDGTKYTGAEWCKKLNEMDNKQNMICHMGTHHIVAIVYDGWGNVVLDHWNSTYGKVGVYWTK